MWSMQEWKDLGLTDEDLNKLNIIPPSISSAPTTSSSNSNSNLFSPNKQNNKQMKTKNNDNKNEKILVKYYNNKPNEKQTSSSCNEYCNEESDGDQVNERSEEELDFDTYTYNKIPKNIKVGYGRGTPFNFNNNSKLKTNTYDLYGNNENSYEIEERMTKEITPLIRNIQSCQNNIEEIWSSNKTINAIINNDNPYDKGESGVDDCEEIEYERNIVGYNNHSHNENFNIFNKNNNLDTNATNTMEIIIQNEENHMSYFNALTKDESKKYSLSAYSNTTNKIEDEFNNNTSNNKDEIYINQEIINNKISYKDILQNHSISNQNKNNAGGCRKGDGFVNLKNIVDKNNKTNDQNQFNNGGCGSGDNFINLKNITNTYYNKQLLNPNVSVDKNDANNVEHSINKINKISSVDDNRTNKTKRKKDSKTQLYIPPALRKKMAEENEKSIIYDNSQISSNAIPRDQEVNFKSGTQSKGTSKSQSNLIPSETIPKKKTIEKLAKKNVLLQSLLKKKKEEQQKQLGSKSNNNSTRETNSMSKYSCDRLVNKLSTMQIRTSSTNELSSLPSSSSNKISLPQSPSCSPNDLISKDPFYLSKYIPASEETDYGIRAAINSFDQIELVSAPQCNIVMPDYLIPAEEIDNVLQSNEEEDVYYYFDEDLNKLVAYKIPKNRFSPIQTTNTDRLSPMQSTSTDRLSPIQSTSTDQLTSTILKQSNKSSQSTNYPSPMKYKQLNKSAQLSTVDRPSPIKHKQSGSLATDLLSFTPYPSSSQHEQSQKSINRSNSSDREQSNNKFQSSANTSPQFQSKTLETNSRPLTLDNKPWNCPMFLPGDNSYEFRGDDFPSLK